MTASLHDSPSIVNLLKRLQQVADLVFGYSDIRIFDFKQKFDAASSVVFQSGPNIYFSFDAIYTAWKTCGIGGQGGTNALSFLNMSNNDIEDLAAFFPDGQAPFPGLRQLAERVGVRINIDDEASPAVNTGNDLIG